MAKTVEPTPASPRKRGWSWIVLVVSVCLLALGGWYVWRGTATSPPAVLTTPEQGVICQLVAGDDGGTDVRTAAVIPVPVETAWRILSNYEEWERLFKTVRRKQVAEPLGENRHHVVSDVWTPLGVISLDFIVTHEKTPGGGYIARWDAPTPELPVNRGVIEITPVSDTQTLFVYTVRKQYRRYPQFVVNNALLDHQPDLIETLRRRMIEVAATP